MIAALGPDPLRPDADPTRAWATDPRSHRPIGDLLLDQAVLAGVGNVYRAEVLFRHRMHPLRPGKTLRVGQFRAMWDDLVELMQEGVRTGRIDTVHSQHTPEAMGRPPRVDDHGGEVYVYRRTGQPCLVCGRGSGPRSWPDEICSGVRVVSPRSARAPYARATTFRTPRGETTLANRALPWRGFSLRVRREMSVSDRPALVFLVLLTLAGTLGGIVYPDYIPSTVLLLPMFIGSLWLGPRSLPWFIVFVCACFCVLLVDQPTVSLRAIGRAVVTFAIALLIMVTSFRRSRLGVSGPAGRVDVRRPARPHLQAGQPAGAATRVAGRVGGEVGGWHLVRR